MGHAHIGLHVWVNGSDRLNIGTNGNTTFSGNVTAPNLYDTTYINAALSTKANVADVYDRTQLYTQIETNNLLNNKQNSLSTLLGDDATTFQILNGTKVKALREGSNIQMTALNGGDEIEIEAVIPPTNLSNYYTKTEVDNSLALKEDAITSYVTVQNGISGPSATLAAFSTHTALACDTAHDLEIRTNPSVNTTPDITISHLNQGVYCAGGINAPSASIASGSFTTSLAVSGTATFTNPITTNFVYQTALPAFQVRKTNGVVYSTIGTIAFNDVVLNQGNCYSGSTFTAPSVGVYHFHFMCQSINVPLEISMKSGTTTLFSRYSGIGQDSGSGAVTVYLIANQTVHLELISGSFWAGNNDTCINFGGYRVG